MANLKGGTFQKQLKDAFHRLSAFGEKRHNTNSHQTHSSQLAIKREEYGRSFAKYLIEKGIDGKINTHMTTENIKEFLEQRTQKLAYSTTENYIRGFGSFITGLKEANISIDCDNKVFDDIVKHLKETEPKPELETGRTINEPEKVIDKISNENFIAGTISKIQYYCGVRMNEAYTIVKEFNTLFDEKVNQIVGLTGKGNHTYPNKDLPTFLSKEIKSILNKKLPTQATYNNILKRTAGITSHQWRYTYASHLFSSLVKSGENYNSALLEVSSQLNHKRAGMTRYYLRRC